ncbi:hypothetical protein R3P38DRAFT_3596210, partial [Favolaschia claudopus]
MHPDLERSRLNLLPLTARRLAVRVLQALSHPGLPDNWLDFMQMVNDTPRRSIVYLLPVFYHFLEPLRVPTEEQLDGLPGHIAAYIASALWCLGEVYISLPAVETAADIWPRIWAWNRFFWTYGSFLRQMFEMVEDREFSLPLLRFCWYLWRHQPNRAIMLSSPGLTAYTITAWVSFTDEDFTAFSDSLHMIRHFLVYGNPTSEDILDGVDDNVGNLAKLIMRQCEFAVPLAHDDPIVRMENMWLFEIVIDIVLAVDHIRIDNFARGAPGFLTSALLAFEFVKTVSISVHTLSAFSYSTQNLRNLVKHSLMILCLAFQRDNPQQLIQTSVQHGLLHIILCCARWHPSDDIHRILHFLLMEILGPYSVYCGPLAVLESSHAEVTYPAHFSHPAVCAAWTCFSDSLRWRCRALNLFRSRQRSSLTLTACDNVECEAVLEKNRLKRCSGCRSVLYCCRSCQIVDWRDGHRKACVWYLDMRTKSDSNFTREEYAFLRFLLHQDHVGLRAKCVLEYAKIISAAPNTDTISAGFLDYCTLPVSFKVYDFPAQMSQEDADYWQNIKRRVFKSCGRMSLDFLRIKMGGDRSGTIGIPLRRLNNE